MNKLFYTIFGIVGVAVVGALLYYAYKKMTSSKEASPVDLTDVKTETIEGALPFNDVVGIFKQQHLEKDVDTPFLWNGDGLEKFSVSPADKLRKDGYKTLIMGSLNNKTDVVRFFSIVYCKDYDDKTKEVLGDDPFVVLN